MSVCSIKVSILINIISDGTIIWNHDSCLKGSDKVCVCDREKLFFGLDPNTCQRIDDVNMTSRIKRPGFELDNNGNNYSTCHILLRYSNLLHSKQQLNIKLNFAPRKKNWISIYWNSWLSENKCGGHFKMLWVCLMLNWGCINGKWNLV